VIPTEAIEAAARAAHDVMVPYAVWEIESETVRGFWREAARAALSAALTTPTKCAECGGKGRVVAWVSSSHGNHYVPCPTCGGSGVGPLPALMTPDQREQVGFVRDLEDGGYSLTVSSVGTLAKFGWHEVWRYVGVAPDPENAP